MSELATVSEQGGVSVPTKVYYRTARINQGRYSKNTKRAYSSDVTYIFHWIAAEYGHFNGHLTPEIIQHFIVDHVEGLSPRTDNLLVNHHNPKRRVKRKLGVHAPTTIKRRIFALSTFCKQNKLPNPTQDEEVKTLLKSLIPSAANNGWTPTKKQPLLRDAIQELLVTCDESLRGKRDSAILYFGFSSGGRRRSEIAKASVENLQEQSNGSFVYNLNRSKTNKVLKDFHIPIKGKAARALREWLRASEITEGPIFRGITKGNTILKNAISCDTIANMIKERCASIGLDPSLFSGHSLRSGFMTQGGLDGHNLGVLMNMSGHNDTKTASGYVQVGEALSNPAADILE